MTRYCAIDIESSGLDWERCQILEIGCVIETDWLCPVADLPRFRALVNPGFISGESFALNMNAGLIAEMAKAPRNTLDGCVIDLAGFLGEHFGKNSITIAGKNFASFDLNFLRRSEAWHLIRHKHRFIDVGNLWWNPLTDPCLPDLTQCLERAGLGAVRPMHNAIGDCESVIECVRAYRREQELLRAKVKAEFA